MEMAVRLQDIAPLIRVAAWLSALLSKMDRMILSEFYLNAIDCTAVAVLSISQHRFLVFSER